MRPDDNGHRLAIVISHPTQYYSPWFRWVKRHTSLAFRVFYLWEFGVTRQRDLQFGQSFQWDTDLLSGYDHDFVPNTAADPGTHHLGGLRNPALLERLAAWDPTVVLTFGYKWHSMLRAIGWARRRGLPLLFRGDSHFLGRPKPPLPTRLMLRFLYARFHGFLYVGAANRDYFTTLGVRPEKLHFAPHAVDHTHFDPNAEEHQGRARAARESLGLAPDTRVVLFAGKFLPAKQPVELLEAFLTIATPNAALVLVGDGELKDTLQHRARGTPPGRVHFLPFANQSEMPARYLLADIFALPSRGVYETWGLAVNEAMHMGVPALVSDRVGCQRDLVTNNLTGWTFAAERPGELTDALRRALEAISDPTGRTALRAAVSERIRGYTYEQTTHGLKEALGGLPAPAP